MSINLWINVDQFHQLAQNFRIILLTMCVKLCFGVNKTFVQQLDNKLMLITLCVSRLLYSLLPLSNSVRAK